MARARNIKPGFFKNYDLADLGPYAQLLFAGLWCLADKEGRLEDKPRLIKAEVFPYYDVDVNGELTKLERLGFLVRYQVGGQPLIEVCGFKEHQSPHHTEKPSTLPGRPKQTEEIGGISDTCGSNGELTVNSPKPDGGNPPDSLIHRFTDSLIPDSTPLPPTGSTPEKPAKEKKAEPGTGKTWAAYADAYKQRYHVDPVRNATVNGQMSQVVRRLGADEAPLIAAFYVKHNGQFYVSKCHGVGPLLADAEKLRTEWATNRQVGGHALNRQEALEQRNREVAERLARGTS